MKKIKTQNGITLIALIITIIVLLILAGVAIKAIGDDGGIITKTQQAADKYTQAQKDELADLDSYVSKIDHINIPDELVKYILGPNGTGRAITEVYDPNTGVFLNDPKTEEDETITLKVEGIKISTDASNNKIYAEIKYNGGYYGVTSDISTMFSEKIEEIYVPRGNEGKTVKYDSDLNGTPEEWTVITDRNGTLEIVSNTAMGGRALIGVSGYNDAIKEINEECRRIVTAKDNDGVRSIGAATDTAGLYSSANFSVFDEIEVKDEDNKYEEDYRKLKHFGIFDLGKGNYWIASRQAIESNDSVSFCVRFYHSEKPSVISNMVILRVNATGNIETFNPSCQVRPVVINPKNIEYVN